MNRIKSHWRKNYDIHRERTETVKHRDRPLMRSIALGKRLPFQESEIAINARMTKVRFLEKAISSQGIDLRSKRGD